MSRDEALKFDLPSCPGCGGPVSQQLLEAPDRFHGRHRMYRLVRCSHCSLVWTQNPPHPSAAGEHYGTRYDQSVTWAGEDPERWRGRCDVLRSHKPQPGAILDLGCSAGGFLTCVKRMGWRCYGIEMSTGAANLARSRAEAEVFVGDILDAPYAPESFDAITCFHVLEHIYRPRDVLAKISGWLKPGGVFYSMVPNIESAGAKLFGSY
ncbi:MAG TPA: class I SAM-dependent methyltransferase, partial [Bryobacteraceae bacterium]|nr:class I SAM-dependent methyltransferase [Bryobacteraceae bacterium]